MPTVAERGSRGHASARTADALLDTSTAIALLVVDHEAHARTVKAARALRLGLSGHAWFETFSVLTRLPAGVRRSPADVQLLLEHDFPGAWFLDEPATSALMGELGRLRISGGAVYDALVGAAARHHDLPLLTSDRRALRTYDALGVRVRLVE
jgi:predicted nucleic acid-binding protein